MREILFRGKRVDNREWVEGYYASFEQLTNSCIYYVYKGHTLVADVDHKTICQYTGLTDKNGKKIFEGDIVRAIYKPKDEDLTTDDFIIKWDKYYCKYVGHYARKENVYNPLLFGSQTSFEVIGNIFDNPELLNEEDEEWDG